jgi:hypothetical protein
MDESKLLAFTMSITSLHFFGMFLPPVSEIALSYQSPSEKQVIREAEFIGALFLVTISAITSFIAKSPWPMALAVAASGSMYATYEYALARVPNGA